MMSVSVLLSDELKTDDYGQGQPLNTRDYLNRAQWPLMSGRDNPKTRGKVILIPQDLAMLWRALHLPNLGMSIGYDSG